MEDPGKGYGVLLKLMGGAIHNVHLNQNFYLGYQIGYGLPDPPLSAVSIADSVFAPPALSAEPLAPDAVMGEVR